MNTKNLAKAGGVGLAVVAVIGVGLFSRASFVKMCQIEDLLKKVTFDIKLPNGQIVRTMRISTAALEKVYENMAKKKEIILTPDNVTQK